MTDYGKAVRLQPTHAEAYFNRALIETEKRDYAAAVADYEKYLRVGADTRKRDRKAIQQTIRDLRQR